MYSLSFCVRARRPRPDGRSHYVVISRDGRKLVTIGFALCCHSNATRAPITNRPNSAQLGGSLYHAAKLHPGPCSSVGVPPRTDRQTDTQTRVTTIHFASSTTHAKCNYPHKAWSWPYGPFLFNCWGHHRHVSLERVKLDISNLM